MPNCHLRLMLHAKKWKRQTPQVKTPWQGHRNGTSPYIPSKLYCPGRLLGKARPRSLPPTTQRITIGSRQTLFYFLYVPICYSSAHTRSSDTGSILSKHALTPFGFAAWGVVATAAPAQGASSPTRPPPPLELLWSCLANIDHAAASPNACLSCAASQKPPTLRVRTTLALHAHTPRCRTLLCIFVHLCSH